jgi:DNA-binding MarR family transcriptional regulator
MPARSTDSYPFGDLLALARQSWIRELAGRLAGRGYPDYRRSDAAALRLLLRRGAVPVGQLGYALGVTRQAASKAADGLRQRGFATVSRDGSDARQLNVTLTPAGRDYALDIIAVIDDLNADLARRVAAAELTAAVAVLRAAMFDDSTRGRADALLGRAVARQARSGP